MQITQKIPPFLERNLGNVLIIAFLAILYIPILLYWYDGWLNKSINIEHEYFSHALIGFPYATYLIFGKNRHQWQKLPNKNHPLGGFLLALGLAFYITGSAELVAISFPIIITGVMLWLKGMPGLRLNGFPLLLILLATPNSIPYLLTPYTLPLQKFIAAMAGFLLQQLRVNSQVDGIYLYVNNIPVEVAPYCAGLKMLFTSLYVSLLLLHWTGKISDRGRVITLLSGALIISTLANIIRNTLLAVFHGNGQHKAFEILHDGWGGDIYSTGMLIVIIGLNWSLDRFEESSMIISDEKDDNFNE
ncbi:cyanoexosortase B [Crocosphaera sp. XPORK-15E]|uniref:cyanoexosortase B n=1 Tax=Crocosphaera sp. XPORK-15E TaxID=3110247 RepID=UPI002B21A9E3|nr:cyanoexosortase B [Crocosphaera sp. XPORK-15E]MEA5533906.1 cyanoexosortase B [Crocosphaera sp. XPORK-15E]